MPIGWKHGRDNADGFRVHAKTDGNIRYVSVRPMPEYPLFVNIIGDGELGAGRLARSGTAIGSGSAMLLLCSIYLLIAVTRQVRRLSDSKASLTQKSQQLDAALNNMSQGLSMFDGQQRLVICNKHTPRCTI